MTDGQDGTGGVAKTTAVRAAHRFDQDVLQKYLAAVIPNFAGQLEVTQFGSGQSNPTFLLSTPQEKYVLRKKPPGELLPSAHQVEREFKIMAALAGTNVAVPEVLHLCEDASVIGTNFFVMRYVAGRIFSHPSLPGMNREERGAIYDAAAEMLARLHAVNFESVGLANYGRRQSFVARQLSRWTKQYMASKTAPIEAMDKVIEWLSANIPDGDQSGVNATLVHGDYRLDNMIFHPTRPEVLAVLDWELSTLGNPLSDLGYFSMIYHLPSDITGVPGLAGLDLIGLGIPDENEFVRAYFRHVGYHNHVSAGCGTAQGGTINPAIDGSINQSIDGVDSAQQRYFVVFSLFRLAAIAQGVYFRAKQGVASAPNAEAVGRMAEPCAKAAWKLTGERV